MKMLIAASVLLAVSTVLTAPIDNIPQSREGLVHEARLDQREVSFDERLLGTNQQRDDEVDVKQQRSGMGTMKNHDKVLDNFFTLMCELANCLYTHLLENNEIHADGSKDPKTKLMAKIIGVVDGLFGVNIAEMCKKHGIRFNE